MKNNIIKIGLALILGTLSLSQASADTPPPVMKYRTIKVVSCTKVNVAGYQNYNCIISENKKDIAYRVVNGMPPPGCKELNCSLWPKVLRHFLYVHNLHYWKDSVRNTGASEFFRLNLEGVRVRAVLFPAAKIGWFWCDIGASLATPLSHHWQ